MTRKIYTIFTVAVTALVAFTATAFAAGAVVGDEGSLTDLLRPVYDAVMHGHAALAAALLLVVLVAIARRYGVKKVPWFATDMGASVLVLAASFGGAVATALTAQGGDGLSLALLRNAAGIAAMAAGGWKLLKTLVIDPLAPYIAKGPGWLQAAWSVISWVFATHDPVADAEKAGAAAVAANPSPGAGEPKQWP